MDFWYNIPHCCILTINREYQKKKMIYLVDLELVVDVLEGDAKHGEASARLIDRYRSFGELYIAPVAYIQLGPLFNGLKELQDKFLGSLGIALYQKQATDTSGIVLSAWCRYVQKAGPNAVSEMPFTKLLIGANALGFDGLLTRRPDEFTQFFPKLNCITQ